MLVYLYFVTASLNPEAQSLVMVEAEEGRVREEHSWPPVISYCFPFVLEMFKANYPLGSLR